MGFGREHRARLPKAGYGAQGCKALASAQADQPRQSEATG